MQLHELVAEKACSTDSHPGEARHFTRQQFYFLSKINHSEPNRDRIKGEISLLFNSMSAHPTQATDLDLANILEKNKLL